MRSKFIIAFIFCLTLFYIYISRSVASIDPQTENTNILFDDEFNGKSLNTQKWDAYPNGGKITVSNGVVTLTGGSKPGRFPFIQTKINPIPLDDGIPKDDVFSIETRVNFASGSGIGFVMPFSQQNPNQAENIYSLDTEGGIWSSGVVMDGHNVATVLKPGYHTYKFNFHGTDWFIYVDGKQVAAVHDNGRPAYLNFGNPNPTALFDNSTSLKIDYIRVTEPKNP